MTIRTDSVFYLVFLGQIFLMSYYFPEKILRRMRSILETYPPAEFPKLYPKPVEYYKIGHATFQLANRVILGSGLVLLVLMLTVVDHATFADDGFISEAFPAVYGMIQFLPLMALELLELSQFKLMRKATTRRKAEMRRRRLFDFVSPTLLALAVALYLAALYLDLYAHEYVVQWGQSVWLTVGNLFLVSVGAWNLYGRKLNPHQASGDRARQVAANLKSMVYVSIAMNLYYMTLSADVMFDLDFLDATLISLYFQAIAFLSIGHALRSLKIEQLDFDVYRADPAAS